MNGEAPGSPKLPLCLTAVTAILSLLLLGFIQSTIHSTTLRYTPWVDASMEIKLEVTLAHLWFEENMAGDTNESMATVRKHLAQAKWYANAMLDGGSNEQGKLLPLNDDQLRLHVNRLLYQLEYFHRQLEERFTLTENTKPGTKTDEAIDILFRSFLSDANQLEAELKQHIFQESQEHNSLMLMLMFAIFSMALISGHAIWRFTQTRSSYLKQLSSANKRISEQNLVLQEIAHTDQLTGLPNRKMLEAIAHRVLGQVHRKQTYLSVSFIDLDFFKPINDQYGHHVGDKVLIATSQLISEQLREGDTLARLAGDEFILLLQAESETALRDSVTHIFYRIQERLKEPVISSPAPLHIRLSAGTAIAPLHGEDFETLMHHADLAMYMSKEMGRGSHYFFQEPVEKADCRTATEELEAATE